MAGSRSFAVNRASSPNPIKNGRVRFALLRPWAPGGGELSLLALFTLFTRPLDGCNSSSSSSFGARHFERSWVAVRRPKALPPHQGPGRPWTPQTTNQLGYDWRVMRSPGFPREVSSGEMSFVNSEEVRISERIPQLTQGPSAPLYLG